MNTDRKDGRGSATNALGSIRDNPPNPRSSACHFRCLLALGVILIPRVLLAQPSASSPPPLASVQEMIDARTDVWGDAAMRQPNGASYEFFKDLLPPVRWTNTDFRHYPIVLSAPRAPQKARLISNGSAVNARANKPPMWYEQGTPVKFFVGKEAEPFGADLTRLSDPTYVYNFVPEVLISYRSKSGK
jgi:hypothetical protein